MATSATYWPGGRSRSFASSSRGRASGWVNAASAIDLGKLGGSYTRLREFSTALVQSARENDPGTVDFRALTTIKLSEAPKLAEVAQNRIALLGQNCAHQLASFVDGIGS